MRFPRLSRRALALATVASVPALAQTPPADVAPANGTAIEQIVVTANKRRQLQRDVADSITAISGKELDRKQQVRLQDLAADVPGLSLETDDKTALRIVLRGLNTGSAGATVASLVDDVPTNATGAQTNASTNTPNFDTYDLQRIEVLRGPQGTLYGATAEGGLIKYVTNEPDPTRYSGGLETGIAGNTDGNVGGSLKGFVNLPLLDGKAALRLTGWNEWVPGYVDNPTEGKTNTNSAQQYGWRASLLLQEPVPDLTVRLTAERQSLFSNNADQVLVQGDAANPAAPARNQLAFVNPLTDPTALSQPSQNEAALYYGTIAYDLGWATATSITAFTYAKFDSFFDVTNTNVAAGLPISALLSEIYGVPLSAVDERQISNTDKFNQELRLASDTGETLFGRELSWIAGGYYTHETSAFVQRVDARGDTLGDVLTAAPGPTGGSTLYGALSEWAAFGQVDYHFLPQLDLELGGRWSGNAQHSDSGFLCCLLYGPASNQGEISSNSHDALYSVAPRWKPTEQTMVYGRIATGYRPGGPNIPIPGLDLPKSYQPDHTVNYEVGVRQDLFQNTVSLDITGYYISWKDVQILSLVDTPSGPVGVNGNAGTAVSKGVEWSLIWAPLPGLKFSNTGAYDDARLTRNAPGLGGVEGDFLPYVPNISNSLTAEYSWKPAEGYRAYVSGTWTYTGPRFTGFAPAGGVTESHVALPAYNTGALRAGLERGRYSLELFATNISDARGITYYANQGGADQTGLATLIQPRTIGLVGRVGF